MEKEENKSQPKSSFGIVVTGPDGKTEHFSSDVAVSFGVSSHEYASGQPFTLYTNDTTKYSLKPQYKASLSYGDDGKVSLKVSKSLADRNPDFLKEMRSNSTLKSAIKAYENNTGAQFVDPNDDSKTISAKEVIDMWGEGLQDYMKSYAYIADAQDRLNKIGKGVKFSEEQARLSLSSLNRGDHKNSSKVALQLPSWATAEKYGWSNYDSYDAETHSINAKDFYDWYNLDKAEEGISKGKEDMLTEIRDTIENMIMSPGTFKDVDGNESELAKDDYAKTLSFFSTLNNDTAEIGTAWTGMKFFAESFGATFLKGVTDTVLNIPAFFEGIATGIGDWATGVEAIGNAYVKLSDGRIQELTEDEKLFGRGPINQVKGIIDQQIDKQVADWRELTDVVDAGVIAGTLAVEIAKQVLIVNPIGKQVGAATVTAMNAGKNEHALVKGFQVLLGFGSKEQIAGLIAAANQGFSKVGFATNVLAQGVADALLADGALMGKAIMQSEGALPGELLWSIGTNTTYNLIGEFSGIATTKFGSFINDTNLGKMLNYHMSKQVADLRANAHDFFAKIADWVHGVEKAGNEATLVAGETQVTSIHKVLAEKLRAIADVKVEGEGTEALEAALDAQRKLKLEYVTFQNVWRSRARGVARYILTIDSSIDAKTLEEYNEATSKLMKSFGQDNVSKVAFKTGDVLPKDATDYIMYTYHYDRIMGRGEKRIADVHKKDLEWLQEKITALKNKMTPEQIKAAEDYKSALEKMYYELNNFKVKNGLVTADELTRLRSQPEFGKRGELYIFSVAKKEGEDALLTVNKALENSNNFEAKTVLKNFNIESSAHEYVDPVLALNAFRADMAKVLQSKEWGRVLVDDKAIIREIASNAELSDAQYVKQLEKFKGDFNKSIDKLFKGAAKDLSPDAVADFAGAKKFQRAGARSARETMAKAQETMNGLVDPKMFAANMTSDQLDAIKKQFNRVPDFSKRVLKKDFDTFYDSLPKSSKKVIEEQYFNGVKPTASQYNAVIKEHPDLADTLTKNYIANDKAILSSKTYKNMLDEEATRLKGWKRHQYLEAEKDFEDAAKQKQFFESISGQEHAKNVSAKAWHKDMLTMRDSMKEIVIEEIGKSNGMGKVLAQFTDNGIDEAVAKKYLAIDYLNSNAGKKSMKQLIENYLSDKKKFPNLSNEGRSGYSRVFMKQLETDVESEWNLMTNQIRNMPGGENLVDTKVLYSKVLQYAHEIDESMGNPNIIRLLNDDGTYRLVEVDPVTADLYNNIPNFNQAKQGMLNKFFRLTNRIFKLGTTGWSIKSFTNQWFRDTMNSYVMAGLTRTIGQNTAEFAKVWGDEFVEMLKKQMTEAGWDTFVENAAKLSPELSVEEATKVAAVEQVTRTMPAAMIEVGGGTSAQYFRGAMDNALAGHDKSFYIGAKHKMQDGLLSYLEDKSIGNWREVTLRKMNYAQGFRNALDSGMSVSDAKLWAEYVMDNATTDFSRPFAWGNRIANSIPYLGAAINGSASFWRLVEVDPLGVSGRFLCGMVLPSMALYMESFANEENRKVYQSIPEYEKDQAIAFVYNGKPYTLPIPQEIAPFFAPIRQVVEAIGGVQDNEFHELLFNDLLSIPSVNLSAFVDLDHNKLLGDPTIEERFSGLAESAISQLSPAIAKTVYMWQTGRDPYTGKDIDTSWTYIDKDGNTQIMDYTDSWFAHQVANVFGEDLSPSAAYALLKNMFGTGLVNMVDGLSNLFSGDFTGIANRVAGEVIAPVTMYQQEESDREWKDAIRKLEAEKQELLDSGKLQSINGQLSQETDAKRRKGMLSEYNTVVRDYQNKVISVANALKEKYSETYNKSKLASVISLLNFSDTTTGWLGNAESRAYASDSYYNGREAAIATMYQLGFHGDYDYSVFGYLETDAGGNTKEVATTPLSILNAQNISYSQKDIHIANLEALLKQNGITRNEMFNGENGYYTNINKGMSKKQAKAAWNAKVVPTIVNYINKNGWADDILSNSSIVDMLQDYIFVDNPYKAKDYLKKILKGDNK